jgi:Zn-dependent protease with chaperone function
MKTNGAVSRSISVVIAVVLISTQSYAVVGEPQLPDPGNPRMTRQEQIQLGYQTAAQVYKQMPVLPDNSPETQYIRQLGEKLVAQIPPEHSWPFQFHVIPQKEINAFALPGGPMFVNIGTIVAADNEAQLVGVMAHEMAHVYMQHSAKQASSGTSTLAGLAGLAGQILGATGGWLGQLASVGIQVGANGIAMKYSRTDEAQADAVGAIIMYKAGYNPQAMADFFQKLAAEGSSGPQWLSDHPNPGNREAAIQKEIASWPPKNYQPSSAAFTRIKQEASSVTSYSAQQIAQGAKSGQWATLNQRNGAVLQPPSGVAVSQPASANATSGGGPVSLDSVLPSSRLVTTNLGPLSIARPDNWEIVPPGQRGADLLIGPRAGITGTGIGYGVAINAVSHRGSMSIDEMTQELVQNLERSGDMQALGSPQNITVGGVQGRSAMMQTTSPFPDAQGQQQKERDWLVTVPQRDGSAVYFVFVAPQSQFDRFRPTFENMLKSVQF